MMKRFSSKTLMGNHEVAVSNDRNAMTTSYCLRVLVIALTLLAGCGASFAARAAFTGLGAFDTTQATMAIAQIAMLGATPANINNQLTTDSYAALVDGRPQENNVLSVSPAVGSAKASTGARHRFLQGGSSGISASSSPTGPINPLDLVIGVGEVQPGYWYETNGKPNNDDAIVVASSPPGMLSYSLSPNGPFAVSIALTVHLDSSGYGETQTYYTTADRTGDVMETGEVASDLSTTNYSWVVVNVSLVYLHPTNDNKPLDANPNPGGGLRIFPDKLTPTDTGLRNYVSVFARISSPIPGVSVVFKRFDVDDPSNNSEIDPNGADGGDNRDPLTGDADVHAAAVTDAYGFAATSFRVPMQPGDNIKIAAVCSTSQSQNQAYMNGVLVDGTDLLDPNSLVPLSTGSSANIYERAVSSEMLTTWRKLHVEADSMGAVHGNYIIGKVTSVSPLLLGTDQTQIYVTTRGLLENGRFEHGRIVFDSSTYFKVLRNDTSSITVQGRLMGAFVGRVFQLFDDDDFNNNNGVLLDGDEGEEIPVPDTSLVQDSDDPGINVFAPAYIRPTYDLGGNGNVPFVLNTPADTSEAKRSMYQFANIATEADPAFWTAYILGAYQHTTQTDFDPDSEAAFPPPLGGVLGTTDGDSEYDAQGAMIFVEAIADAARIDRSLGKSTPAACKEAPTVAHELGHLLYGPYHDDKGGGLMTKRCNDTTVLSFSPSTLAGIRSAPHP